MHTTSVYIYIHKVACMILRLVMCVCRAMAVGSELLGLNMVFVYIYMYHICAAFLRIHDLNRGRRRPETEVQPSAAPFALHACMSWQRY